MLLRNTTHLIFIFVSSFIVFFGNFRFFYNLLDVYPLNFSNLLFIISLAIVFISINVLILGILCVGRLAKVSLIFILLISSLSAYFMDTYNIVIDDVMINNLFQSDFGEAKDLINLKLVIYFLLLGVLPSYCVLKTNLTRLSVKKALISRALLLSVSLLIPIILIFTFSAHYTSFIREHKILRFYANPSYYMYSTGQYIQSFLSKNTEHFAQIGLDADIPETDTDRELIILVIGETARADHFSLNGYQRKTNPLLENEDLISFTNVWACGTSTSVSVPCLFSIHTQDNYQNKDAFDIENALDVMKRAGVNVLWLDNNSDSKGVADRINFINYKSAKTNPICDDECRDVGMLSDIQHYIDKHPKGDIFIILHQMGSHGPAYYKRYPKDFEKFLPSCQSNQLETCSHEEIINAYDNTILYTDYFLAKTIQILKHNQKFETVMLYVSDHGESLGENGIYLHGLPYLIAPDAQKHVPMIAWFGDSFKHGDIDYEGLKKNAHEKYSHDNMFHTLLGLLEIDSDIYDPSKDIIEHLDEHNQHD